MHQPPAVSYRVVRSRWHLFVIISLTVAATCGAVAFVAHQNGAWRSVAVCACIAASGTWAFFGWQRTREGRLRWDGQDWHGPTQGLVQVRVVFDFQHLLLIRIIDQRNRSDWIWFERVTDSAHWLRLRRALVASQI